MKSFVILATLLACYVVGPLQQVHAQVQVDRHIDSLIKVLSRSADDTGKVLLLDDLSFSYYTIDPDKGLKYGQEELTLAQQLEWKKGMALAYNSIGDNYLTRSNFLQALDYYFRAVKLNEELHSEPGLARNYNHIGVICKHQKKYLAALDYYSKALHINRKYGNQDGVALNLSNIGNIYCFQGNYDSALANDLGSLAIYTATGDSAGIGHVLGNIGLVYKNKRDYPRALDYYFRAFAIDTALHQKNEIEIKLGNIGACYLGIARSSDATSKVPDKTALEKAIFFLKQGIGVARQLNNLVDLMAYSKDLSEAKALAGRDEEAYETFVQYRLLKDSVFSIENNEKMMAVEYERKRRIESIKAEDERKITNLRVRNNRNLMYAGIGVILLLSCFTIFIVKERGRSEKLLLNILPAKVVEELKANGVAKPRHFDQCTVLFAHFTSFAAASRLMGPRELIDELHSCFTAFDDIMTRYGIEKIKTIGDRYLAAAGLPSSDSRHAENVVRAAGEMLQFMKGRKYQLQDNTFDIRIGIHSGSVVAGVVGLKKFAYDIWGDTVNTAARMEQSSEQGKINISQTTYDLVKDRVLCTYRGTIAAKNKGQLNMYFVV